MQFAGQRTTENLEPLGKPDNLLVKLSPDVLPDPFAILVHGITPQQTISEGISEADFVDYFEKNVAKKDTVFIGYNNIRFDDDFVRYAYYRSLRDPYEWHWRDGRSRWDLLDPIRMMRALRPEGLEWPFAPDGKPTVSLGAMTQVNNIEHGNAHDALADIQALIELAQKYLSAQPKLFKYLLDMRDKERVEKLVDQGKPFVYTSGKYSGEFLKTTVVHKLVDHPKRKGAVVYDLRVDPTPLFSLSPIELARRWRSYEPEDRLPLKSLFYNRCPAVADISVLSSSPESQERIKIDLRVCEKNRKVLVENPDFAKKVLDVIALADKEQQAMFGTSEDADESMYDAFWKDSERLALAELRRKNPAEIIDSAPKNNDRINELAFRFVARNFPEHLTQEQSLQWETTRAKLINGSKNKSPLVAFGQKLQQASMGAISEKQQFLLTELELYVQSILPYDV